MSQKKVIESEQAEQRPCELIQYLTNAIIRKNVIQTYKNGWVKMDYRW